MMSSSHCHLGRVMSYKSKMATGTGQLNTESALQHVCVLHCSSSFLDRLQTNMVCSMHLHAGGTFA